jgi:mannose-1-phosphate guanylyltransferase / mannose-6-phosphate isomerase
MSLLKVIPVILCGGEGTRLWPLSRTSFPKQFLVLSGNNSLFQQAVERGANLSSNNISLEDTLIVTGENHRFLVLDQLREMPTINARLLLEPEGRNTAPALTLASFEAIKNGDDPILVVMPADQTIENPEIFNDVIKKSIEVAASGSIVVLGVEPTSPETGFGYIKNKRGDVSGKFGEVDVEMFTEKPDFKTAQMYLASGEYSWNAGIFILRASVWINAIETFRADIFDITKKAFERSTIDQRFIRPDETFFKMIEGDSIDFAVIEKCPGSQFEIKMISLNAGWSDLGSWDSVWQVGKKDADNNLIYGDTLIEESKNNLIYSSHRLVTAVGVNDLVIIETPDAIMVSDRLKSQNVKEIVNHLSVQKREESVLHRKVSRPWGWYDTIEIGDRFKVKRIQVNPGASLSLQKHGRRAEHWVVVKGIAKVVCGEKVMILKENESTFIPLGKEHRLSNPFTEFLEIIEVQSGNYLGEDDIVRIDDGYGRN